MVLTQEDDSNIPNLKSKEGEDIGLVVILVSKVLWAWSLIRWTLLKQPMFKIVYK